MTCDVLLVIPAVREADRLPAYLKDLAAALATAPFTTTILIIDDGSSPDEQQRLLQKLTLGQTGACRLADPILLPDNHGKGYAIIHGWRSGGEARFYAFVDADGAIPAPEVLRLLTLAITDASPRPPCLWASRKPKLGRTVQRNAYRQLLGRIFAQVLRAFIQSSVYDNQCGFKVIPRLYYQQIASLLQEARFCFDIELQLAVRHAGATIMEVPIDWRDIGGGQLRALRDGWAMLRRLPAIRRRAQGWTKVHSVAPSA